jgi:Ca2+/Na+ antiporter
VNTTTTVIGTAGLVALAKWTNDQQITMDQVIGILVVAFVLAVSTEVNDAFARQFGTLIFITAVLLYGPKVAQGLGLAKKKARLF